MNEVPRVLVAGDNEALRTGLRLALAGDAACSEAELGEPAAAAAERERPQVCFVDCDGDGRGLRTVHEVVVRSPATAVVVLSSRLGEDEFLAAMRAGASGYLPRRIEPGRLPHVVRGLLRGEPAVPRHYVSRLVEELRGRAGPRRRLALSSEQSVELTEREWETLALVRQGLPSREIAARLGISQVTVRRHLSATYAKLGVTSRASALDLLERAAPA